VKQAWAGCYSPAAIEGAVAALSGRPLWLQISLLIGRLSFRGIYFPQMGRLAWLKVAARNRRTIFKLVRAAFKTGLRTRQTSVEAHPSVERGPDSQEA
jgi:hypothetical protein